MLPELPDDVGNADRIKFYKELLSRIRSASEVHRGWYTHKNPYGCWICDLLLLVETCLNYIDKSG